MKRAALIVTTPGYPGKPLPGAEQDAKDWGAFLPSVEGGAWENSEITILRDPSPILFNQTLASIQSAKPEFGLVAFSGHGEVVKTTYSQETRLYLNPTAYTTDTALTLGSPRELAIIDACRELRIEPELTKKAAIALNAANENFSLATNRRVIARKMYDDAIIACPTGKTLVYSCSINETAADQPSFTRLLIGEALDMAVSSKIREVISSRSAFNQAVSRIASTFKKKQTPVYDAGRRLTDLPFAISV